MHRFFKEIFNSTYICNHFFQILLNKHLNFVKINLNKIKAVITIHKLHVFNLYTWI